MKKILKILGIFFIVFYIICYFLPPQPPTLDDCLEFGICAEGLELKDNDNPYTITKEYCIEHYHKWDDEYKICHIRIKTD